MGLLDDYSGESGILRGLGKLARPTPKHQYYVLEIASELKNVLKPKGFVVLTESCIDVTKLNSKAPDVIVYDQNFKSLMFIEITTTKQKKVIETRAAALMQQYNILESFIYDYETGEFNKLTGLKQFSAIKSYSDIFQLDLKIFV